MKTASVADLAAKDKDFQLPGTGFRSGSSLSSSCVVSHSASESVVPSAPQAPCTVNTVRFSTAGGRLALSCGRHGRPKDVIVLVCGPIWILRRVAFFIGVTAKRRSFHIPRT